MTGDARSFRFVHHELMGTTVEVFVGGDERSAEAVDAVVVDEIRRLERVFSAFDDESELCRWRRGAVAAPSREFAELMGHASAWHRKTDGRFNPLVGRLRRLWRAAEAGGRVPDQDQLAAMAASIRIAPYEMVGDVPVTTGDCSDLEVNAIVKGYIVDRSLDAAHGPGASWVTVNAGGDLAHRGSGHVRVGIENPHRPYDNEPPLSFVEVSGSALATSGTARRGFWIGGQWHGHLLDPTSGQPVTETASISVTADDAMTADVVATAASVLPADQAIEFLVGLQTVEALVIRADGRLSPTPGWGRPRCATRPR